MSPSNFSQTAVSQIPDKFQQPGSSKWKNEVDPVLLDEVGNDFIGEGVSVEEREPFPPDDAIWVDQNDVRNTLNFEHLLGDRLSINGAEVFDLRVGEGPHYPFDLVG